tara:strand:- start:93 stop:800 length:708 start_codon:yes stop_codon:yes gene_type:complete
MMTDSEIFKETYSPINRQIRNNQNRESESTVPFTVNVQTRKWSPLYDIETESICLSITVPYHIIGKIAKSLEYGYKLCYYCYLFLTILFYFTFYLYNQLLIPVCQTQKGEKKTCFEYQRDKCETKYVQGSDGVYYPCSYNSEYDICYQTDRKCIEKNTQTLIIITIVLLNIISFGGCGYIHHQLRYEFKLKQLVPYNKWEDMLICFFLTPLSLAQQYKDLNSDPQELEGVTGIRL